MSSLQNFRADLQDFRADKDAFVRQDARSPLTHEQQATFEGLTYYPENGALVAGGALVTDGVDLEEEIVMQTTTGGTQTYRRAAEVEQMSAGKGVCAPSQWSSRKASSGRLPEGRLPSRRRLLTVPLMRLGTGWPTGRTVHAGNARLRDCAERPRLLRERGEIVEADSTTPPQDDANKFSEDRQMAGHARLPSVGATSWAPRPPGDPARDPSPIFRVGLAEPSLKRRFLVADHEQVEEDRGHHAIDEQRQ
jgi:hypothetical protein